MLSNFPAFSDEKHKRFFSHIYNDKLINIEMNFFIETLGVLSDNIILIIRYILNQSERIGTYYLHRNSISSANKKTHLFNIPLYRRILGKLRLNVIYSFYEISQKYGISESSARVIDFRTKDKLRKILKKEGFTDE